ncbi:hypothetical protein BAUCODRAFT_386912 [Baudoinia panamericana UAMH 10762]|uniref:Uncharacterized protein n=1 Tax=Baudoinia panamericana (strain UAMH 10762) TaxID=717646 RepID=M2MQD0_BAUPA|nr:uncharacterized protein BAUCODRAFT_386912 [Baudoinia panamericana UAMH 10762]EMC98986.1 hypothetical protein BAUCODRAFT_386912 [Baudoinia panamericana UAMH 10762]
MVGKSAQRQPPTFLTIPQELRDQIYENVLDDVFIEHLTTGENYRSLPSYTLRAVCHQIAGEIGGSQYQQRSLSARKSLWNAKRQMGEGCFRGGGRLRLFDRLTYRFAVSLGRSTSANYTMALFEVVDKHSACLHEVTARLEGIPRGGTIPQMLTNFCATYKARRDDNFMDEQDERPAKRRRRLADELFAAQLGRWTLRLIPHKDEQCETLAERPRAVDDELDWEREIETILREILPCLKGTKNLAKEPPQYMDYLRPSVPDVVCVHVSAAIRHLADEQAKRERLARHNLRSRVQ